MRHEWQRGRNRTRFGLGDPDPCGRLDYGF